jgi:hypothetical protein
MGGSMMEEHHTTAQQYCKDGGPTCNMHQRGTAFVIRFLQGEGVKPIDKWKFSMVMHVCHYSKCMNGVGSS